MTNDSNKAKQIISSDDDQKLSRVGGASSKASTPIGTDAGKQWAGMQATLLKGIDPDAKKLAPGKGSQRQFRTASANYAGRKGSIKKIQRFEVK